MKRTATVLLTILISAVLTVSAQPAAEQIYSTEIAFEKAVLERGMNAAFIEFMASDGVMFLPDVVNARQHFAAVPRSTADLTWNPEVIDVAANGVLGYSIGNSVYRPKGKDDTNAYNGHYLSIWRRDGDGKYRAILDTGINHKNPAPLASQWFSPRWPANPNTERISAADSSTRFFEMAAENHRKAYGKFIAADAIALREGLEPASGKNQFRDLISKAPGTIKFSKRKSFLEAADLAYVHAPYTIVDKSGKETEKGNFVQVWKLRKDGWQIVVDIFVPLPSK